MYTVLVTEDARQLNVHDLLTVVEVERGIVFGDQAVDIVRLERLPMRKGVGDVLGSRRGECVRAGGAVGGVGEGPSAVGGDVE